MQKKKPISVILHDNVKGPMHRNTIEFQFESIYICIHNCELRTNGSILATTFLLLWIQEGIDGPYWKPLRGFWESLIIAS